jgi:cyanophycinase
VFGATGSSSAEEGPVASLKRILIRERIANSNHSTSGGGVIGGSSAGAMILSSFLVRGGIENDDFQNLVSKKNRIGFGFLPNAAIDVHINQRPNGEGDLAQIVDAHPGLLGIGVDTGIAAVVHANRLEVIGKPTGRLTITDGHLHDGKPYYFLTPGSRFDLASRVVVVSR